MSYKVTVDIVLAINALHIDMFRKQGLLRFRISLAYHNTLSRENKKDKQYNCCQPYNIYKTHAVEKEHSNSKQFNQSFIDNTEECYYSRVMVSLHQSQQHKIQECVFFRMYVDVEQVENIQFQMRAQLLFCPEGQKEYIEAGSFKAKIYRVSGFAAYMPIAFDDFGSFAISSFYQAVIMEYKFQNDQRKSFHNFAQFLDAATEGLEIDKFITFYNYYRKSLENQLLILQQNHFELLKVLGIQANFQFIKPVPNPAIQYVVNCLQVNFQPKSHILEVACDELNRQNMGLKALLHQKFNEYIAFISGLLNPITDYYRRQYESQLRERLRMHVFSHKIDPRWDHTQSRYQDSGQELLTQARQDKLKEKDEQLWRDIFPIEPISFFVEENKAIKIFEEVYPVKNRYSITTPTSSRRNSMEIQSMNILQQPPGLCSPRLIQSHQHFQGNQFRKYSFEKIQKVGKSQHIVILVHGFQASRQDFALFKRCLQIRYNCRVFVSGVNEGRTEDSISVLGRRLSEQIAGFLRGVEMTPATKISFIGHSMGGVIIRSALPHLKNLSPSMHAFMSFSSPHLGYLYEPSALIQAGLWLLHAWQKTPSLEELCMRDHEDLRKSILYRLSQNNSFRSFKQIAFVSSSQDEYVPYESARVQKNIKLLNSIGSNAKVISQMVDNLLGQLNCAQISRINVVFDIQQKNFDSLIGRTAHIKYLSDPKFINMLTLIFDKFFA